MSVRLSACNNSAPTRRIFMKFDIWVFLENMSRKFKFHQNLSRITGTLREDQYTFLIICRSFLLRMRNVSDKSCRGNQTRILCWINFCFANRFVYEKMWKNIVEPDRPHMTVCRMRSACCIPKDTNTHSEYVTLMVFPLQQCLREYASVLRYTYIACLVIQIWWQQIKEPFIRALLLDSVLTKWRVVWRASGWTFCGK